jgi:uncharacterized protein YndB with AHSA1/START domain
VLYRATRAIAASPEAVWAVLTDFARYPEWNPFTPTVMVEGPLAAGAPVALHTRLRGRIVVQRETVRRVSPPTTLVWGVRFPIGAIRAERVQRLETTPEGCRYVTEDRIEGPLAPVVERLYDSSLREGFAAMAEALGERVESASR